VRLWNCIFWRISVPRVWSNFLTVRRTQIHVIYITYSVNFEIFTVFIDFTKS
jgi:hypothetical protein